MLFNQVMTNEEIRYKNLLVLIDQYGLKFLADGLGHKSTSALCQLKNKSEDSKTKKPRAVGNIIARRLESVCKKPTGWMDEKHADYSAPHANGKVFLLQSDDNTHPPSEWEARDINERRLLRAWREGNPYQRESLMAQAMLVGKTVEMQA